ncbi:MAG TPA: serine/threonine-protein kinase, partial [Kofleriaceae bacterium]|nr:serine/threonine-protein kinase [Kofleriaceae bacterium]
MTATSDHMIDLTPAFHFDFELELAAELFCAAAPATRQRGRSTRDLDTALHDLEPQLPGPGQQLDKYLLERPIGIGGFAVVYRARHLLLDTTFALKLLRPSVLRNRPELASLLGEEARMAAKIHHPNVVRVVDVTMGGAHSYIVMEYISGPDLSAMLRQKGLLPAKMVMRIVGHVAAALRAGLSQQLVHRDIKPSNILLTREGVTKLVDFGLARSHEIRVDHGAVVGTLGYMSPEHMENPQAVDHRSDIFSLGVTAYRAVTGVLPVTASTAAQALALLRSQPITPPHRLNPKVNVEVGNLIMWMLQLDPARRPRDYDTLIAAAEQAARASRR